MPSIVACGEELGPENPLLDVWTAGVQTTGDGLHRWYAVAAPHLLECEIRRIEGQTVVIPRQTVDLLDSTVPGQQGRYAAIWEVPVDLPTGRYEIRWYIQMVENGSTRTERRFFDVVEVPPARSSLYLLPSDLRAEGFLESDATDDRLVEIITLACEMLELYTQQFFEPRYLETTLSGEGGGTLRFGAPVILLSSVRVGDDEPGEIIPGANFRLFNRHITQRLTDPDDRAFPRAVFTNGQELRWWRDRPRYFMAPSWGAWGFAGGEQNIRASGVFGYTDWDGSAVGATPRLIAHIVKLIARREIGKLGSPDERESWRDRWRVTSEKTRDQSWTKSAVAGGVGANGGGEFTGDAEIDGLIARFCRPFSVGGV